ncbi:hypothetical protein [Candidatus Viadribacter manganicus]|uniref:Uncharacterized protein n=1 Tax=Candidatus Viadribacter manganicus TaxID=1759059 RepID=A0A1B1ADV6_9PROT|nr:hypothetical protein [Candidatus Viadribacter manganicus]ANP44740.1 hypothetical protein ATE48_01780 [Candidatus Viadribacter manganicus]
MNAAAISLSSLNTSLLRYGRSRALWLMLLVAPIGARYMLPFEDGGGIKIAVGNALPVMTSPFLGVSLGIIVSTLVLPIAWLYLRSNTTRRQPWQVEEVTAGSRISIALGRFAADAGVLLAILAALNLAGVYLATFMLQGDALNIAELSFALWVVAAPALVGLAALRILFDARPLLRSGFGDFAYFCVWIGSIAAPIVTDKAEPSFAANMWDFAGFVTPLKYGAPPGTDSFSIGGGFLATGTIDLDVMAGLLSPGYLQARLAWVAIAVVLVVVAGLIYAPHKSKKKAVLAGRLGALLNAGAPPRAIADAPPARRAVVSALNLLVAEFRLIGSGRAFVLLACAAAAVAAIAPDFRHAASPVALLVLLFALSAHAGRAEARGLVSLTKVADLAPMARRAAFILAGAMWSTLLALPALVRNPSLETLTLASATGAAAALVAILLSTLTGSSFAARLVLLVLWYGYSSS